MLIIRALSFIVNIYMVIIFIRIILTWFSWVGNSLDFLSKITDPYLNWFRRFPFLRLGFLDLSPIAALGILTLVSRILGVLAYQGRITLGIILALLLQAVWGAVSFILIFLIIILVLRFIAIHIRANRDTPFWRVVETISQPILFRINRIIFKERIMNYQTGMIISIAVLGIAYIALRILVSIAFRMLVKLPV